MIKFDLPASWNNISLGEYLDIQQLVTENISEMSDEDIVMNEIQIIYKRNPHTMTLAEFTKCVAGLSFLSEKIPNMKVKSAYTLNGCTYYLHKKLSDFRVAQYIDYEQIMRNNKGVDAYPYFISLFLTPSSDGVYGEGYDVGAVAEDVRKYMSIADANSIAGFFLRKSRVFIATFLWSSHRSTRKMMDRKGRRELRRKTRRLMRMVLSGESLPY